MSEELHDMPRLNWTQLTDREQMVWAAYFAQQVTPTAKAAKEADHCILRLRSLDLDKSMRQEPEYDASRTGINLELEEFSCWYRVAVRMQARPTNLSVPTPEACQDAYERYTRSRSDFY